MNEEPAWQIPDLDEPKKYTRVSELKPGQTILAGIPERKAVITAISDRDPGRSPVTCGKVLHLSGAHDMTMFEYDRVAAVGDER